MTLVISCEVSHLNSVMKVYVVDKLKIIKNKFFTIIQIEIHTKIVLIILTNSNSFTKKKSSYITRTIKSQSGMHD